MNTSVKKSNLDNKDSFIVDYTETMKSSKDHRGRDEIRKISDDLYLGIGYFLDRHGHANLDKTKTYPFSLEGPAKPFKGEQFE